MRKFSIPKPVISIINTLNAVGQEAYIVGGCVRDLLLGMEPADWDITTSAEPELVKSLFSRTVDTGLEHGTVTVMIDKEGYEVTTYRVDGKYEDHRRPKEVCFTKSLKEDLLRRDFTINAMAYNDQEGIIDLYKGQEDLENALIRCVGKAEDRFMEDALRMLRAIRFSAKLDFDIEETTYEAIKSLAYLIEHVSAERIQVELSKTLISKQPDKIRELVNTGLIKHIIPEYESIIGLDQENPNHCLTVDEHTYRSLLHVEAKSALRWAMYFHDMGKGETKTVDDKGVGHFYGHPNVSADMAKTVLKRLKFDNKTLERVTRLVRYHDYRFPADKISVRKGIHTIGQAYFDDYLKIRRADIRGQHPDFMEDRLADLDDIEKSYQEILADEECVSLKNLAVNGNDILSLGVKKGKSVGRILEELLELVLDNQALNTKVQLLGLAKEIKDRA